MIGLSTSCQKELAGGQEPAGNKPFTITASIADSGTKVSYAEDGTHPALKPSWEVNDVIIGFDGDGNTYGYSVTEVNNETKKATLEIIASGANAGGKTVNPANGTKMYMFYAPGKKPTDIGTKSLTVSLASQDKDVVPALMMASATVTDNSLSLDFQNKTAIIGIKTPTMTTASKQYTSVVLSGTGINTEVVFSLSGETLQALYQTAGTITKTLDFTSDASTKQGPDVIYIVACPLTTDADLTFTFNGDEEYFKVANVTMAPGHYYYMTPTTAKKSFGITKTDVAVTGGSFKVKKGDTEVTSAQWDETIMVEVTKPQYYAVDKIKVYKTDETSTKVSVNADGTFTMPKYAVTIEVTFTPDGSAPPTEMPETIGL